jgi:hypothetical protein
MKKVKHLIGALGAAPALAMLATPANAALAVSHAPKAGKTVVLLDAKTVLAGVATCTPKSDLYSNTGHLHSYYDTIHYSKNKCEVLHSGLLGHAQTSLSMRTRVWNDGAYWQARFVSGSISPITGHTTFFFISSLNHRGSAECGALVYTYSHGKVAYGAACEDT